MNSDIYLCKLKHIMSHIKFTKIYTDGSCLKNPGGASGWSFCILRNNHTWLVSGGETSSTNNRMELQAVIEALSCIDNGNYEIFTDSMLTLNCAKGLWKRKANKDLWNHYDQVSVGKNIHWVWVKGHSGDKYNDLVDVAARNAAINKKK